MGTRWFFVLLCCLFLGWSPLAHAQEPVEEPPGGMVQGSVVDSATEDPLAYATVSLYHESDSSFVTAAMTDDDGMFALEGIRAGKYFVEASFAGYESSTVGDIVLSDARKEEDVGEIALTEESAGLPAPARQEAIASAAFSVMPGSRYPASSLIRERDWL